MIGIWNSFPPRRQPLEGKLYRQMDMSLDQVNNDFSIQ